MRPGRMNHCSWWHGSVALLLCAVAVVPSTASAVVVNWQSWSFDYRVSGDHDGLSLRNVTYQGRTLIGKVSFPVMRVFYANNSCGPYADLLGWQLEPIPWANDATIARREFTLNGRLWYEIGIRAVIGDYDIYQVYYLSADGIIDAHIYSKGLQCVENHIHYPNWRIDFDLDGKAADQILRNAGSGFEVLPLEFNANATTAANHAWRVRDATTGLYVDVLPGFPDFSIPGATVVPESVYSSNTVFGRLYRGSEDTEWTFGPNVQVPFGNNESISNTDVVLWYEAYLPHAAADGSELWHSTGVRLVSSLTPPPPDGDVDGVADDIDNCTLVPNPTQCDSDADGYGNHCDGDLNNNGATNAQDTTLFRQQLGQPSVGPTYNPADVNCSGSVNAQDSVLLRSLLDQPPGPSGALP